MAGQLASSPSSLYGLVDMGSNGIRYSVTDLTPPLSRTLPTLYQDRLGLSLYDAQYPQSSDSSVANVNVKQPIPEDVIAQVIISLKRFQVVCLDFGVPPTQVRVLATEATRTAVNSEEFRGRIKAETGWDVDLLSKEMEGRIGAMGVASGFGGGEDGEGVEGLVMDLGGGSTQLTWLTSRSGTIETSPAGSFSFPYGAAAMTRLLAETDSSPDPASSRTQLAETMKQQFSHAFTNLQLPPTLEHASRHGKLRLYLSGGGFRGWGYLLLTQHKVTPYPIPIINGFTVSKHAFMQTASLELLVQESSQHADQQTTKGSGIFRISKRRAAQVPAVAFLVNALVSAIPSIRDVRFCQGGVREGFLFDSLSPRIKAIHPLASATAQYAAPSASMIAELLHAALPPDSRPLDRAHPKSFTKTLSRAIANLMYLNQPSPKETRALAALYAPITGVLSPVHGISHVDRALLALSLYARWDGEVAPPHDDFVVRLQKIITAQEAWWAGYLGSVAALIGNIYPAGIVPEQKGKQRVKLSAKWAEGLGKKGLEMGVLLTITVVEGDVVTCIEGGIRGWVEDVEKVGKRKKREGLGLLRGLSWGSGGSGGSGGRVETGGWGSGSAGAGGGGSRGGGTASTGASLKSTGSAESSVGFKGNGGGGLGVGVRVQVEVERVREL